MDFVKREDIKRNDLPGRSVQNAVGRNSAVASEKMTVSFCQYNAEYGPMAPHNHADFPELEWHVFGYDEGGFLEALCIYGQVTNIRPEEIQKENG